MAYQPTPELEKAINEALEQTRTELLRLYEHGDVGAVTIHCGHKQLRVKASPERIYEPIPLEVK